MAEQMKKRDIIIARNYYSGIQFANNALNVNYINSLIIPANWHHANVFQGMNSFNFWDIWITVRWMDINEHLRFQLFHQALMTGVKLEDVLRFPIMKD